MNDINKLEYQRRYKQTHKEYFRQYGQQWRTEHPDKCKEYRMKSQAKPGYRASQNSYYQKLRREVIAHYGDKCACCGESNPKFLTLDHINNDGNTHRKETGHGSPYWFKIRKEGYPPIFQVLCYNCNCGRHYNGGICPHKE